MELEKEIIKLQEEYQKIILEIQKLKEQSKIKKEEYEEKEYEFDRENNRLFNINEDIDCNIETNNEQREQYINNSLENLEINILTICSLLFTIIGITICQIFLKDIDILSKIGIIATFTYIGGTMSLYISDISKNKYKNKLETKYEESDQFKEYQSQLTEFKQRKETIEKEHQTKYQIYKSAKVEYNEIINQINIKKEELNKLKEKLISLVFSNNILDETKNLTNTISFENDTENKDVDELERKPKTKQLIPR